MTPAAARAVLFDIDGTLFDTQATMRASARAALTAAVRSSETGADADAGALAWTTDRRGHYDDFVAGRIDFAEQRRLRVIDLYAEVGLASPDPAEIATWLSRYAEAQLRMLATYDDVLECLRACADRPMAALSNNDGHWQRERMTHAGLSGWFTGVWGIGDVGTAKPDPAAFLTVCRSLGVDPAEVVYVGDELDIDARAATAAGLRGVWLDRGGGPGGARDGDVVRITTLTALPALLRSTRVG